MPFAQTQQNQDSESVTDAVREGARGIAESGTKIYQAAIQQSKSIVGRMEDYVGENPWRALGIAASAGLLLGLLMRRH